MAVEEVDLALQSSFLVLGGDAGVAHFLFWLRLLCAFSSCTTTAAVCWNPEEVLEIVGGIQSLATRCSADANLALIAPRLEGVTR